jgi:hypothetical protein
LGLLGREAEARAALAVRLHIQPGVTLTWIKEASRTDSGNNLEFHRLIERYYDGLRKAGVPE